MHVGPTRLPVNGRIWETVAAPRNISNGIYEPSQQNQALPITFSLSQPTMQMQFQNNLSTGSSLYNQKHHCPNISFDGPNTFMRPSGYNFVKNFRPIATNDGIIELRLREGIM